MRLGGFLSTLTGVLLGFVAGVITVQTVAPDLLRPRAQTTVPSTITARVVASGTLAGIDELRQASGEVQLLDGGEIAALRFLDLSVTEAPDMQVWLSRSAEIATSADVRAVDVVAVGAPQGWSGEQTLILPPGLDPDRFAAVLIWCGEFRQLYGRATLER